MVRRTRPGILVGDGDAGQRRRIAILLGEAGIGVTASADGAAALSALSRDRFDRAVAEALANLHAAWFAAVAGEARRFPLDAEDDADARAAEQCIAAARLACLEQRQHAARRAGAGELVAALAREIAEAATPARLD